MLRRTMLNMAPAMAALSLGVKPVEASLKTEQLSDLKRYERIGDNLAREMNRDIQKMWLEKVKDKLVYELPKKDMEYYFYPYQGKILYKNLFLATSDECWIDNTNPTTLHVVTRNIFNAIYSKYLKYKDERPWSNIPVVFLDSLMLRYKQFGFYSWVEVFGETDSKEESLDWANKNKYMGD